MTLVQGTKTVPEATSTEMERERNTPSSQRMGTTSAYFYIINTTVGTGILSIPSGIFQIVGSVGVSMILWVLASLVVACGLTVSIEFGLAIPRSGGEKNYLERIYQKPKYLITCVLGALMILLGGCAATSVAFGSYLLLTAGYPDPKGDWAARGIAAACITCVVLLHSLLPKWGVRLMNCLALLKIIIMLFIICAGFAALAGYRLVPDPHNFEDAFTLQVTQDYGGKSPYQWVTAFIRIMYCYGGSASITYIMDEFKNPTKSLAIAAPLGLVTVTVMYMLVHVAYFAAIPKSEFASSDLIIAGYFFRNMFGEHAAVRILYGLVTLSNLGSVLAASFAHGRINQEFAKEGILPYSEFWASAKPFGAPSRALFLNWVASIVLIVCPPPGPAYTFIIDLVVYPHIVLQTMVVAGLLWLRCHKPTNWSPPWRAPFACILFTLLVQLFLAVMPWAAPPDGLNAQGYPFYIFPVAGLGILLFGVLYWVLWAKVWPRIGGYRIEASRMVREDGTEVVQYKKVSTSNLGSDESTSAEEATSEEAR